MAIKISNTTVIDDSRNLVNIGGLKTVAGQTLLGSGDIVVVSPSDTQTLTNKTISVDNNTVGGIAASSFVLSNSSGNIDGAVSQKAIPTGDVVGTTDTQTLTNKTISVDNNTVGGIAASSFVLSNASGNIDGAATQKTIPSGTVVGTTDTQTLTNKTISVDNNTVGGIAASSFVLSNSSGNIDGAVSQKAIPTGDVVGTTDTQTLTNKTLTSLKEARWSLSANEINLTNGNYFTKTISGATTFTVSNVPASGTAISFILDLTNGGSAVITWWTGVKWAGGSAPTLTVAGRDVLGFFTHDAGATWTGLVLGLDVK